MAICKHLVELLGGEIGVESEIGEGSRFTFTAVFEASAEPSHPAHQGYHGLNVLVVDNNVKTRAALVKMADAHSKAVEAVSDGRAAIAYLKTASKPTDLILMDYRMPEMDGISACEQIKKELHADFRPKVLLMSLLPRGEVFSGRNIGCIDEFVSKPITPSKLYDVLDKLFVDGNAKGGVVKPVAADPLDLEVLKGVRLLLAEDNIVNQRVAAGILKKKGVDVTLANNGREALDIFSASVWGEYDVVLMDVEIPVMNRFEATREIRQRFPERDVPIIAMTAHAMRGDREKCLKVGMDAYVSKPIDPLKLYQTVAGVLSHTSSV